MLTDKGIARLKPKKKPYNIGFGRGLSMRVGTSGRKSWYYNYKLLGRQRSTTFGCWPEVSIDDALDMLRDARKRVLDSTDPAIARGPYSETSFGALAATCLEEQSSNGRRQVITGILSDLLLPAFGPSHIGRLRPETIEKTLKIIELRKGPGKARLCRAILRRCFDHAVFSGLVHRNPVP